MKIKYMFMCQSGLDCANNLFAGLKLKLQKAKKIIYIQQQRYLDISHHPFPFIYALSAIKLYHISSALGCSRTYPSCISACTHNVHDWSLAFRAFSFAPLQLLGALEAGAHMSTSENLNEDN